MLFTRPSSVSHWLTQRNKTERDQFHEVVLHGETPAFITTTNAATVAEVESGSTFRETWCNMVQRFLKLLSQRRCTQVSGKSFNV